MPKFNSIYVCQQCGYRSSQFLGRCPECGTWNSLVESVENVSLSSCNSSTSKRGSEPRATLVNLDEVQKQHYERVSTGILEFDRVLGGGIVPGSVVLVAGDPGIGKSTLLLQLALQAQRTEKSVQRIVKDEKNKIEKTTIPYTLYPIPCLYVAGEESAQQIKIRAERISPKASLNVLNEVDVDVVCETIKNFFKKNSDDRKLNIEDSNLTMENGKIDKTINLQSSILKKLPSTIYHPSSGLVVVDSIQTMETEDLQGIAGSVGQVREAAHRLQRVAKALHIPIFIVGHVTKEGTVAGPKTLEHLVDVVLSLEGESSTNFRVLRAAKNRFGSTDEVGIFEMEESGMVEVQNPSKLFLEQKVEAPGSAVVVTMTGMRPLLVEIQALVTKTFSPIPRRVGSGIDNQRLQLLTAVLTKRLGLPLFDQDVFVNVTGGLKMNEPAVDLGIALAIVSSLKDQVIFPKTALIGEVGLLGEIRPVRFLEKRVKEAKKLGFAKVISSENARSLQEAVKLAIK